MYSLRAGLALVLSRLYRFSGVLLVSASAGACVPVEAGYNTAASVAGIAPQILNAAYVPGAREFCRRNPRDCVVSAVVALTAAQEEQALAIHRAVNHALTWTAPEVGHSGRTNAWHILNDGGNGPCTDFAATKLDRMMQAGLPAGAFSFALVHVDGNPGSVLHLVLVAKFRDSLYVLDSRDDRLWRPQEIRDYAWLSYRSFDEPGRWRAGTPSADPSDPTGFDRLILAEDITGSYPAADAKAPIVLVASRRTPVHVAGARRHAGRHRPRVA